MYPCGSSGRGERSSRLSGRTDRALRGGPQRCATVRRPHPGAGPAAVRGCLDPPGAVRAALEGSGARGGRAQPLLEHGQSVRRRRTTAESAALPLAAREVSRPGDPLPPRPSPAPLGSRDRTSASASRRSVRGDLPRPRHHEIPAATLLESVSARPCNELGARLFRRGGRREHGRRHASSGELPRDANRRHSRVRRACATGSQCRALRRRPRGLLELGPDPGRRSIRRPVLVRRGGPLRARRRRGRLLNARGRAVRPASRPVHRAAAAATGRATASRSTGAGAGAGRPARPCANRLRPLALACPPGGCRLPAGPHVPTGMR